jgi:hypothetical protein
MVQNFETLTNKIMVHVLKTGLRTLVSADIVRPGKYFRKSKNCTIVQSQKFAKVYMSMWTRLGRFIEIYGPEI